MDVDVDVASLPGGFPFAAWVDGSSTTPSSLPPSLWLSLALPLFLSLPLSLSLAYSLSLTHSLAYSLSLAHSLRLSLPPFQITLATDRRGSLDDQPLSSRDESRKETPGARREPFEPTDRDIHTRER